MKRKSKQELPRIPLSEVEPAIRSALESMIATPEALRPFVLVEDVVTERFVQFYGSIERGIFLDVPALSPKGERCRDVADGAARAIATLRGPLGLPDNAQLIVLYDTQPTGERS